MNRMIFLLWTVASLSYLTGGFGRASADVLPTVTSTPLPLPDIGVSPSHLWKVHPLPTDIRGVARVPLVRVDLGDGKPHWFGINAGAGYNAIDRGLVASLRLSVVGHGQSNLGTMDLVAPTVRAGSYTFPADRFIVMDISKLSPDVRCDGLLGRDLSGGALEVDFSTGRLTFCSPGVGVMMPLPGTGWSAIPMDLSTGEAVVQAKVDGRSTFMEPTLLTPFVALSADPALVNLKPRSSALVQTSSQSPRPVVRLTRLSVGDAAWMAPVVVRKPESGPGNLALDFLHRYDILFNFANRMLYLKPNPRYSGNAGNSSLLSAGVGILWSRRPGKMSVRLVIQPSPAAAAGIRPKDQILEINGKMSTSLTEDEVAHAILGVSSVPVRLKIKRAGEPSPVVYTLRRRKLL